MSKKFRKLLVPEGYRHYWSKYPEGYTILEALLNWVDSVNQLTDNVNDWNIYLEDFVENFDEKLAPTVREMLNEMDQDGRLAEIINDEIFSWKADKTYVDDEIDGINTQLAESVNEFKPSWSVWEEFDQRGINVTWFGAVADANYYDEASQKYFVDAELTEPATNNKPAFQAAVDFLYAQGGGTIYVPRGNYAFRSGVKWLPHVSLVGDGMAGTKLFAEGEIFSLIYNTDGATNGTQPPSYGYLEDCCFEDFEIDMKGLTYTSSHTNGKALFILYMKNARFNNLTLKNSIGTALGCDFLIDTVISNVYTYNAGRNWGIGGDGGYVYGSGQSGIGIGNSAEHSETVHIINCHTYNSGFYGIFVETQGGGKKSKHAKIINCHAEGNLHGFSNMGSGGTQFIGCTSYQNVRSGFVLRYGARDDQLIGCTAEENGEYGVHIWEDYRGNLQMDNIKTNNNAKDGIFIEKNTSTLNNVTLNNIQALGNGVAGLRSQGNLKHFSISNSILCNNGKDETVPLETRCGLSITGVNDIVSILGNVITDNQTEQTQRRGIYMTGGTTNLVLDGNNVSGHLTDDYDISNTTISNGKIGTNIGFDTMLHGEGSFADGQGSVDIDHYFGRTPGFVTLIPKGNQNIWVSSSGANKLTVYRSQAAGNDPLDFTWKVEI